MVIFRQSPVALALLALTACAGSPQSAPSTGFDPARFAEWSSEDPAYRLYPGDEITVTVYTANELSGPVTVGPDGRANLPMLGALMVADLTEPEAARLIAQRYSSVLRDPIVEVRATGAASQNIFVGGEVATPGLYPLPDMRTGTLEAVLLAGGFQNTARRGEVVVLRRAPDGSAMMRTVDLRDALSGRPADQVPLRRHDIVFVPRSTIAEVNLFVEQYIANIVPFNEAFGYALANSILNDN
ncbi:polysaccharide secretin protein HfsD [Marinicauda pacifica]|uniref:Polysaccharide export protein n=1 Tax=Marinicauda pacifica TaxID=1133559 RepID=A0A4S2HF22_9PROT|nr:MULTISPECIES: polysaccharide biosynthesis/export family protein [Marinicauda]TGY94687.1 polysaccharide export protein [Marinicauda pacifica]GGE37936.1 polysaccharide secretin protein HfsD [Marinicauda pacifica]